MVKLLKTGIAGFDEFVGGGLPEGNTILLLGEAGIGNLTFACHIAYNRVLEGKPVTYVLVGKSIVEVERELEAFNWKIQQYVDKGLWKFLEKFDDIEKFTVLVEEMEEGSWLIFDSLSDILLVEKPTKVAEFLKKLSLYAKKFGGIHFFVLDKGMFKPRVEALIQHFVDGVIVFDFEVRGMAAIRYFVVKKMVGKVIPQDLIVFSMNENGIIIETATRIT